MAEENEKKRISDVGLLLYFNNYDQIKKIDSKELGELIKKEMEWQLGLAGEPEFDDVRCDCFHSTIKAEIKVRDKNADRRNKYRHPQSAQSAEKEPQHLPNIEIEEPKIEVKPYTPPQETEEPIDPRKMENPTIDDVTTWLVWYADRHGKIIAEMRMNDISRATGFTYDEIKDNFKMIYDG